MQKITVITVGNLKEKYLKEAINEYSKRLSSFCRLEIIEIKESRLPDNPSQGEISACLNEEAKKIEGYIPQNTDIVALCIEGKELSSPELARFIADSGVSGKSGITFIIGGSFGIAEEIKAKAKLKLSFSKMTFPHQLFRVMLAEQIYRAFSINAGSPYHK